MAISHLSDRGYRMPPAKQHHYTVQLRWTGNTGSGTASYRDYERAHDITVGGKPAIAGSSDPAFRGDANRWNPEELLVASLAACHKLWYLGLCAQHGIVVVAYEDEAEGCMVEEPGGAGQFTSVTLRPRVTIAAGADATAAAALHDQAHAMCFIARSVNFPVTHDATIVQETAALV
jgi:organic hydroperoxide reductase OsmC/OhrA